MKAEKIPFANVSLGQLFYFDGEHFKKTDASTAWSFRNNALVKEWAFGEDDQVVLSDKVEVIPMLTEEELNFRADRIAAIVNGHFIEQDDIINTSYIWEPVNTVAVDYHQLEVIGDVRTYHSYGYYGLFKPSIAEVLAQIPAEYVETAVAFELKQIPQTAEDLNAEIRILNLGYHVAQVRVYRRKKI